MRQVLSGQSDVVEKKMVGGLSFLVNGNMRCGITGRALMVRVGAGSREQALREPHVQPMLLAGRALSGFICIEPEGYTADDALAGWVQGGLELRLRAPQADMTTWGRDPQQELHGRSLHSERQKRMVVRPGLRILL